MAERHPPRFTLTLTLRDNHGEQQLISYAYPIDHEVRISSRAVEEMKLGLIPVTLGSTLGGAVEIMRRREFRKKLFEQTCTRLGALLAERMEDAEGWHDVDRIKPAREQIGGDW